MHTATTYTHGQQIVELSEGATMPWSQTLLQMAGQALAVLLVVFSTIFIIMRTVEGSDPGQMMDLMMAVMVTGASFAFGLGMQILAWKRMDSKLFS